MTFFYDYSNDVFYDNGEDDCFAFLLGGNMQMNVRIKHKFTFFNTKIAKYML